MLSRSLLKKVRIKIKEYDKSQAEQKTEQNFKYNKTKSVTQPRALHY